MRQPLVIGNWKLNGNKHTINKLISELLNKLKNYIHCNIVVAPPVVYLDTVKSYLNNSRIYLGAQNVDINLAGSFTGEISATMLKDVGASYVIIGHCERRILHKESNKMIAKKFAILKNIGLIPVLCIGENKIENQLNQTEMILTNQLDAIINNLGIDAFKNAVIAYEPIWAIGTGQAANPAQVQTTHKFIRDYIAKYSIEVAENIIIQYGGSVNSSNATALFDQPDVDGALVGSASLVANQFAMIIKAAVQMKGK